MSGQQSAIGDRQSVESGRRFAYVVFSTALLLGMTASAMAAPHIRVSATATPRELFAEQRLEEAVRGLPGNERILLATRRDPLLKEYDKQIPDFGPGAK